MKEEGMKCGAYDPLYPNGVVMVADENEIWGLRFLAVDRKSGEIADGRMLDFSSIVIGRQRLDQYHELKWKVREKEVRLRWAKTDENEITGQVEFDNNLTVLMEMYVPWEYRLCREWVNFTVQKENIFAGELISPYVQHEKGAVLLLSDQIPVSSRAYNFREQQLEDFKKTGMLRNMNPGNIWKDMGISWFLGAQYEENFCFLLKNGAAEDFMVLPGTEKCLEQIRRGEKELDRIERSIIKTTLTGNGILKEIGSALSSLLPFNTIYKENTGKRYIMVDRVWSRCEDGWGLQFNWDTFLSSWASSWFCPDLAKENMLSGYDVQLPDGRIPLVCCPRKGYVSEPPVTAGRSQHIVQGLTLWKTFLHTGDTDWLRRCYAGAKKANAWWFADRGNGQRFRDALNWGLLGFGYDTSLEMGKLGARIQPYVAKAQYAYFETYDDSPQWTNGFYFKSIEGMENLKETDVEDEAKYKERYQMADIYTLERCCLYAVDCESLAKTAQVLGLYEEAEYYKKEARSMTDRINEKMWCEEDGCYYNLKFDGGFSKKQSPDCFMPLMTGGVPDDRKKKLINLLTDEKKFWGTYMIPSIAKDDPAFVQQKYWRGQIWPPQVLWTYLGLKCAGEDGLAWEIAGKAAAMLADEWKARCWCPENYNAFTGKCSGAEHYNWGVLMGLPLLEELVEFTEDWIIFGNLYAEDGTRLRNIYVDGKYYDMFIENNEVMVMCGEKKIACGKGRVSVKREEMKPTNDRE